MNMPKRQKLSERCSYGNGWSDDNCTQPVTNHEDGNPWCDEHRPSMRSSKKDKKSARLEKRERVMEDKLLERDRKEKLCGMRVKRKVVYVTEFSCTICGKTLEYWHDTKKPQDSYFSSSVEYNGWIISPAVICSDCRTMETKYVAQIYNHRERSWKDVYNTPSLDIVREKIAFLAKNGFSLRVLRIVKRQEEVIES